jgi:hypothetical protein
MVAGAGGKVTHLMVERKQRKRKRPETTYNLLKHAPRSFLSQAKSLKLSTTSQNSATSSGPSVQYPSLLETFHIQTIKMET